MSHSTRPIVPRDLLANLRTALGLPEHLLSLEIRLARNEVVTVTCEFAPGEAAVKDVAAIVKRYELHEIAPPAIRPGYRGDDAT